MAAGVSTEPVMTETANKKETKDNEQTTLQKAPRKAMMNLFSQRRWL
jgi:hypothetical protein